MKRLRTRSGTTSTKRSTRATARPSLMSVLSDEILVEILSFTDIHDIAAVASVSKQWRMAIDTLSNEKVHGFWLGIVRKYYPDIEQIPTLCNHRGIRLKTLVQRRVQLLNSSEQGMFKSSADLSCYRFVVEIHNESLPTQRGRQSMIVNSCDFVMEGIQLDISQLLPSILSMVPHRRELRFLVYVVRKSGSQAKLFDQCYDLSTLHNSREDRFSLQMDTSIVGANDVPSGVVRGDLTRNGDALTFTVDGSWCPWGDELTFNIAELLMLDVGFD